MPLDSEIEASDTQSILKEIKSRKTVLKRILTRFCNFVDIAENDDTKFNELQTRCNGIQDIRNEFLSIYIQLESTTNDQRVLEDFQIQYEEFEDKFYQIVTKASKLIDAKTMIQTVSSNMSNQNSNLSNSSQNQKVNLPTINLPKFNGNTEDWLEFFDIFKSLIDDDKNLNNVQKFYYLKSCLTDNAETVISSLEVTNANYKIAWDLLKERFENKKILINAHIRSIVEMPSIQKESSIALRKLIDEINKHERNLKSLNQPVDQWATILIYLIAQKLDYNTKRQWETENINTTNSPSLNNFIKFLKTRCLLLETLSSNKENYQSHINNSNKLKQPNTGKEKKVYSFFQKSDQENNSNTMNQCPICNNEHKIYYCEKFLSLNPKNRYFEIKKLNLCINCFKSNHKVEKCLSSGCKHCHNKHNSLLHYSTPQSHNNNNSNKPRTSSNSENRQLNNPNIRSNTQSIQSNSANNHYISEKPEESAPETNLSGVVLHTQEFRTEVLLGTATVQLKDKQGNIHKARALLDSGSQSNLISKELCQKLNLSTDSISYSITGINASNTTINKMTETTIYSSTNSFNVKLSFLVLEKITEYLPTVKLDIQNISIPNNIQLADKNFYTPGKIDLLLGASIFYDLLCIGQLKINKNSPIIQKTKLGWIITGNLIQTQSKLSYNNKSICNLSIDTINNQLKQFWEIENIEAKKQLSKEEEECELEFEEKTYRDENNQFNVPLLTKNTISQLGHSYESALNRFQSLERKLQKDLQLKKLYTEFMKEYEDLGDMEKIENPSIAYPEFYFPHHGILKINSATTKLRVVFDGSAKSSTGVSLNECLKVGPTIQADLFTIVLRFRKFNIVLAADIEKMYRRVKIQEEYHNLQKILWRSNPEEPISQYKLKTVTYGTASAPYLAIRCLFKIAEEIKESHPNLAKIIMEGFYVDDLLYGTDTKTEAVNLKQELQAVLEKSGFMLRKWVTNMPELFKDNSEEHSNVQHFLSTKEINKTLGIYWHSIHDTLFYDIQLPSITGRITKRQILSIISLIFDPLGLIGPFVIKAKILLQELWKIKLDWDESLPNSIHTCFNKFISELPIIFNFNIPRQVTTKNFDEIHLHGFADASEKAFGACVYILSKNSTTGMSRLLCAKSKVAPIKSQSIPKLELCAAVTLTELMDKVKRSMDIQFITNTYWSDSTIVLHWINKEPYKWNQFVQNRVARIQSLTKINEWRHVPTKFNPADLISRGISSSELEISKLWWNGPSWLTEEEIHWPSRKVYSTDENVPEKRKEVKLILMSNDNSNELFLKYSSYKKLIHVTAYLLRFKYNTLNKNSKRLGFLTVEELAASLKSLIKIIQKETFPVEYEQLLKNRSIKRNSKIISLDPFMDENIIRVGGRIKNSNIHTFIQKHPIIIPAKHPFTTLLIKYEHYKNLHAGPQLLLTCIRSTFWIISGLTTVKRILRKCIVCFKNKPFLTNQFMGSLPIERITPSRAFLHTGLDYCGPFTIKANKLRNSSLLKIYVCIFVCFSTKAVHLEIVADLTSECFINCLKRFISRRGKPVALYSDNATTFVGANNYLKDMYEFIVKSKNKIQEYLLTESINWKFIPARSPHHGGIWEACVKSFKFHFKRVINNHVYLFENFHTLVKQIEAVLNSRPLTQLSSDPSDLFALTPGHFLIFQPLTTYPEPDLCKENPRRLSTFQHMVQTLQEFWVRWSNEYILQLQQRNKWKTKSKVEIKEGQLVLCKEDNLPPLQWKLGRILKTFPGNDGEIRVISIKTNSGEVRRAVTKVAILPLEL